MNERLRDASATQDVSGREAEAAIRRVHVIGEEQTRRAADAMGVVAQV